MSNLVAGQKIIVKSQLSEKLLSARVMSFFRLNDHDVAYMRGKSKSWENVQSGDRAFYFKTTEEDPSKDEPRVFVIGYSDLYVCAR